MGRVIRIAAVQATPVYLDLPRSVEKACALIASAAQQGAELVAFGETWLPGYPAWLDVCRDVGVWDHAPMKRVYARLMENSVHVPGPVTDALSRAVREASVVLSIGIHERVAHGPGRGSLYNTQLLFERDGTLVARHRKIMPTFTERMIWAYGDGSDLRATSTSSGRIGSLICWEHWMPLARQALHDSGEDIHVAAWPTVKEILQLATRHYAFEARCFVLGVGSILRAGDLPQELELVPGIQAADLVMRGGSVVVAPSGRVIAGPIWDEETILFANCDMAEIAEESLALDVAGHYARPDIFEFRLKTARLDDRSV